MVIELLTKLDKKVDSIEKKREEEMSTVREMLS